MRRTECQSPRIYTIDHVLAVSQQIRSCCVTLRERPYGPKTDCGVPSKVVQQKTKGNKGGVSSGSVSMGDGYPARSHKGTRQESATIRSHDLITE